jgi:hypothetical protein
LSALFAEKIKPAAWICAAGFLMGGTFAPDACREGMVLDFRTLCLDESA